MKGKSRFVFLAPAMNTAMWNHPITAHQLKNLQDLNYNFIMPIEKKLACGDTGNKQCFCQCQLLKLKIKCLCRYWCHGSSKSNSRKHSHKF